MSSLVIDVLANEWLSSNDRLHWAQRARRTKALRSRAFFLARKAHLRADGGSERARRYARRQGWESIMAADERSAA